jgi:hypothetical protein
MNNCAASNDACSKKGVKSKFAVGFGLPGIGAEGRCR